MDFLYVITLSSFFLLSAYHDCLSLILTPSPYTCRSVGKPGQHSLTNCGSDLEEAKHIFTKKWVSWRINTPDGGLDDWWSTVHCSFYKYIFYGLLFVHFPHFTCSTNSFTNFLVNCYNSFSIFVVNYMWRLFFKCLERLLFGIEI